VATDTLVQIKTPIWNGGDGRRAIGVATFKVPCMVEIIYKDSTGERLYPDRYRVTKEFASNYPIKQYGKSPNLYVIPIDELNKEKVI
jgi:hypothetical protein